MKDCLVEPDMVHLFSGKGKITELTPAIFTVGGDTV